MELFQKINQRFLEKGSSLSTSGASEYSTEDLIKRESYPSNEMTYEGFKRRRINSGPFENNEGSYQTEN